VETGLGLVLPSLLPDVGPPESLEALLATFGEPQIEELPVVDLSIGCIASHPSDADPESVTDGSGTPLSGTSHSQMPQPRHSTVGKQLRTASDVCFAMSLRAVLSFVETAFCTHPFPGTPGHNLTDRTLIATEERMRRSDKS
jgi:hypothetical protein